MKIVHTFLNRSSFVNKDSALFQTTGIVAEFEFAVTKKFMLPFIFFKQLFFILFHGWNTDVFISQFGGYHSFLPSLFARLTGKKSIIISGGTDCVSFPGIGYGNFYRPILRDFTRWSYQLCTHICPKHETLWFTNYDYDKSEPTQQGISVYTPGITNKSTVINNGYDPEKWPLLTLNRKQKSYITVSGAFEYPFQIQLKGIDLIIKAAKELPDHSFTIAGAPAWKKFEDLPSNVQILPPVKHDELHLLFNQHEFYIQISMAEGFPNALCEAMLCGCTPIVSNVFSMPEITNGIGGVLKQRSAEELISLLKNTEPAERLLPRKSIADNYSLRKRENKIINLLKNL